MEDFLPGDPGKPISLPDLVVVRDLAAAIGVKPLKIMADLLVLEQFKNLEDEVDSAIVSTIAGKHGYPRKDFLEAFWVFNSAQRRSSPG